jgi:phage terminase large subunit-like protein
VSHSLADRVRALPADVRARLFEQVEHELGVGALSDLRHDFQGFWLHEGQKVSDEELFPTDRDAPSLVLFRGERGGGKTQAAMVLFDRLICEGKAKRPRIFAAIEGDVDKAVVHGESGIMSLYDKRDPNRPRFLRQEGPAGILRYPGGIEVICYTAKASEGAVSYNADLDLYDDFAKWGARAYEALGHARFSCRIGIAIGIMATTRRGTHMLRRYLKGNIGSVLAKLCRAEENRFNLSPKIFRQIRQEFGEDDDFMRQELDDEDVAASSPFHGLNFDSAPIRILEAPRVDFAEVIVAIDPAEGKGGDHDEWGIGAAGRRQDGHVVALDDASGSYDDDEGADAALRLCELWDVSKIIVESNRGPRVMNAIRAAYYRRELEAARGGEAVERSMPEIIPIRAKDGKVIRAQPLRTLYLQGSLHHVSGLRALEKQQREWDPTGPRRPRADDRIDWLTHAVHFLADLGAIGGMRIEHVEGLADRVRALKGKPPKGDSGLIKSDKVPAGDARSSYRPRGRGRVGRKKIW